MTHYDGLSLLQGQDAYSVFCHHQMLRLLCDSCPFVSIALFIQCRVNTSTVLIPGDLLLTLDFALCLHTVLGVFTKFLAILRWQGIMICWQSHRRETAVGRQYLTLQRQKVLYWLQAWNEKNSIFVWRPEITRNAFKFKHRYIHPGMLARACLVHMSHMASWAYGTWFARLLLCLTQERSFEITMKQSSHRYKIHSPTKSPVFVDLRVSVLTSF